MPWGRRLPRPFWSAGGSLYSRMVLPSILTVTLRPRTMMSCVHHLLSCRGQANVHHVIKAAGLFPIGVNKLTWHSKPSREPFFLVGGVKINAAVGAGSGHDIDLQFEVLERIVSPT